MSSRETSTERGVDRADPKAQSGPPGAVAAATARRLGMVHGTARLRPTRSMGVGPRRAAMGPSGKARFHVVSRCVLESAGG